MQHLVEFDVNSERCALNTWKRSRQPEKAIILVSGKHCTACPLKCVLAIFASSDYTVKANWSLFQVSIARLYGGAPSEGLIVAF